MNEQLTMAGAVAYLKEEYDIEVSGSTVVNWIKRGYLVGTKPVGRWFTTREAIDEAMGQMTIPPKAGRKRTFTKVQREQMVRMREKHSLKEIAKYFNCTESYVSLITRGLR